MAKKDRLPDQDSIVLPFPWRDKGRLNDNEHLQSLLLHISDVRRELAEMDSPVEQVKFAELAGITTNDTTTSAVSHSP